ncbi:site-specific integrase [Streptococcus gallolyticus]|nr:site-specific integrase [Streptococcus gallolyticus]MBY5040671.1 site-specific integrase [Streptococcus gallolyticus]
MATYRQRGKKKTWDYRIYDSNGKLIASNSGFRTKKEAEYEANQIEQRKREGKVFSSNQTLYDLWSEWHNLIIVPSDLGVSTKKKYEQRGRVLLEYFGKKKASKISPSEYQRFINEYGSRVLRNQVSRLNSDVRQAINQARRDGVILVDFTEGVKLVGEKCRKQPEDKYIQSMSDYERMLVHLRSKFDYLKSVSSYLLYFLFKTGMRVGEAMAVCWEDIDWENKLIYTYRRYAGELKSFGKPKTKWSIRYVPVSGDVLNVLSYLKRVQKQVLSERGIINLTNQVFFDYRYGVPSNSALNRYLRRCLKELSIDGRMTATGTRHTYGSYLLANGVDIWVVSKIFGHKDIKQLTETYGHLLKEKMEHGFEQVRELMAI